MKKLITIDGPAASGKTSVSNILAQAIGFKHISSGLIYRIMAYYGFYHLGSSFLSQTGRMSNYFLNNPQSIQISTDNTGKFIFYLLGRKINKDVFYKEEIASAASEIAKLRLFRDIVLRHLIRLSCRYDLVADGRDMGTVVFPNADYKFFLVASATVRAKRRALQNNIKVDSLDFELLLEKIKQRDQTDATREIAPTKMASDAVLIDTDTLSEDEVVEKIKSYIKI